MFGLNVVDGTENEVASSIFLVVINQH